MDTILQLVPWLALIFLILTLVAVWRAYPALPPQVPIHFGFRLTPDGYGRRPTIWILPITSIVMWVGFTVLPVPDAATRHFLGLLGAECVWMFYTLTAGQIRVAVGQAQRLSSIIWLQTLLVMVTAIAGPKLLGLPMHHR